MCGIVGVVSNAPVNQLIYDALLLLQHRGQDAAGIVTQQDRKFFMHKAKGMVRDVFRTRNMRALPGNCGLGQVRYPTAGNAYSEEEAQPFYVNAPFGIVLVHNGNLTNAQALKAELFSTDHRHINTESDSEVLLNVLAHELERRPRAACRCSPRMCSPPCAAVHRRVRGSYAVVALIAGHGMLAFRDPLASARCAWAAASRRHGDGGQRIRGAGRHGHKCLSATWRRARRCSSTCRPLHARSSAPTPAAVPLHLRIRVPGAARFGAGRHLGLPGAPEPGRDAGQARGLHRAAGNEIDVVIPIPESSRPSATQLAQLLGIPYREGFVKNRYVGRTFIMPGQAVRKKSVRQKLNVIASEFKGRNVLLVDDSIVRGTTSREIVQMARDAGARKVYMASAAPPVRYPNVYGIDMPTSSELVAHGRTVERSARSSAATR
jgi:amidophosphoribosyltransferase